MRECLNALTYRRRVGADEAEKRVFTCVYDSALISCENGASRRRRMLNVLALINCHDSSSLSFLQHRTNFSVLLAESKRKASLRLKVREFLMNFNVRRHVQMAFDYADTDGEGSLTRHRYKVAMTALFGYCPDKMEVNYVFRSLSNGKMSFKEFKYWVFQKCPTGRSTLSLETIFGTLDDDRKGYLTLLDFVTASKVANMRISLPVWFKAFKELDQYQKGYIDLTEFIYIFTSIKNNINISYM